MSDASPSTPGCLKLGEVTIVDTFAEAFPMTAARVVVTAASIAWARTAGTVMTGYATSVIACDAEAGIERELTPEETPDGRPGLAVLLFAFNRESLEKAVVKRVGQCVMTCPTTACYDGIADRSKLIRVGGKLRRFGDGFQISKVIGGRRYWRIPVMDGEFVCEDEFGTVKGVGGGNILILGCSGAETLAAAERAVEKVRGIEGVIMPFPGGVVRSGSKVGSKYKGQIASTNHAYAPTLKSLVTSDLPAGANCCYEIVIDGLSPEIVAQAMRVALHEAAASPGVVAISAGNYGGKLGPFHFRLSDCLSDDGGGR
ncbi:formylmethanofuran--tetrahydromethanopterin N-formyltransferase [bacterium]|nr:formylmethanofuran--tetrahydromethanopterin N-formyltransferase [bacterium]